ncbi:MAG: hypothetical protein IKW03_07795 [Clostridia bacterium]|nr:hypothetical protein [Clostridia bacterium]
MKVLVQRAELAQEGYVPADYKGDLNFADPGELNGEIPVDIGKILSEADDISADNMAEIKMN